jgi:hypothetical protein
LALGLAVVILPTARGDQAPKDDVGQLVAELGSGNFSARQEATMQLQAAGKDAIPHIVRGLRLPDAEIRSRLWTILQSYAQSPRGDVREAARKALKQLESQPGDNVTATQAGLARIRGAISSQAASELTRLGALAMPVQGASAGSFNVQLGQAWAGGDEKIALVGDLGSVPWLSVENAPVTDAALTQIANLAEPEPGITKLYLGASGITGEGLPKLAPLKQLQYLSLKQLPIDDRRLAKLPEFPHLQYLGLDGTRVTDAGLAQLARFPRLQMLWLDNTRITDAGMVHLKRLPNLDTLYMPGTATGGAGLAELREAPRLKSISIKSARLQPDSLKYLAQIEQLESLGLDNTNVSDEQLADLAGLKQLRILWLSGTKITDAGLEHLKNLKSLQIVHLNNTEVTRDGATELERALPRCQITIDQTLRSAPTRTVPRLVPPRPAVP